MDSTAKNMTLILPDGSKSAPFSIADIATVRAAIGAKIPMKETEADKQVSDTLHSITASELRAFIERYEVLQLEKADVAEQQKGVVSEAKGRGFDTKALRKVIALRKRNPDDIAEEQAVLDLYLAALGMA